LATLCAETLRDRRCCPELLEPLRRFSHKRRKIGFVEPVDEIAERIATPFLAAPERRLIETGADRSVAPGRPAMRLDV
jgi:hypothetical protein